MARSDWGSADLGGTIGTLHGGAKLRVATWDGAPDGPGTVIIVQGRAEFIEFYEETIRDLRAAGHAVVAFDLRGQGGSERKSKRGGHIDSFRQYADDIVSVVRYAAQIGMPRPFSILAHSMGGTAALLASPMLTRDVERMVLTAPLLKIAQLPLPYWLVRTIAWAGVAIGMSRTLVAKPTPPPTPDRFPQNRLTTDKARYTRLCALANDNLDLNTGPPTVGWMQAAFQATSKVRKMGKKRLPIPTLFVGSGADTIVSTVAIDRFARAAEGGGLVLVRGARHQILYERDEYRGLFFAAFRAFVTDRERTEETTRPSRNMRKLKFVVGQEATGDTPPVTPEEPAPAPEPATPEAVATPEAIATPEAVATPEPTAETTPAPEPAGEPVPAVEPMLPEPEAVLEQAAQEAKTAAAEPTAADDTSPAPSTDDALVRAPTGRKARLRARLERRRRHASATTTSPAAPGPAGDPAQTVPNGNAADHALPPQEDEPIAAADVPASAPEPIEPAPEIPTPEPQPWDRAPLRITPRTAPAARQDPARMAPPPKPIKRGRSSPRSTRRR